MTNRGMTRRILLLIAFVVLAPGAFSAADDDQSAIRPLDVPKDAPRFEDYPAQLYTGPNAAPDVQSEPLSRRYRTQLRGWATEKPNFAGHYIVATWGCGTSCTQIAVIDAASGKVFHPAGIRINYSDVDADLPVDTAPSPRRADFDALRYRPDSRLLIVSGTPEGRVQNRGISYFVWENEKLRRLRLVRR
jgi:hypothetical protein